MVKIFKINKDAWKKELEDKGFKILTIKYVGGEPMEVVVEPLNPSAISMSKFTIKHLDFEEESEEYLIKNYTGKAIDKIKEERRLKEEEKNK